MCLFVQTDKNVIFVFVLYVDDMLMLGDKKAIEKTVCNVKEAFKVTTAGKRQDFLGCKIIRDDPSMTTYVLQPFLIEKMIDKYGTLLPKREFKALGTPGFVSHLKEIQ